MMTTVEVNAADIFSDARGMGEAALERMAAGDVRDAAEKAWCATMRATEALVFARTGQEQGKSTDAGRRLRALSVRDPSLLDIRDRYIVRQEILHGECFYHNYYELEEIDILVNQTSGYIADAERLASSSL